MLSLFWLVRTSDSFSFLVTDIANVTMNVAIIITDVKLCATSCNSLYLNVQALKWPLRPRSDTTVFLMPFLGLDSSVPIPFQCMGKKTHRAFPQNISLRREILINTFGMIWWRSSFILSELFVKQHTKQTKPTLSSESGNSPHIEAGPLKSRSAYKHILNNTFVLLYCSQQSPLCWDVCICVIRKNLMKNPAALDYIT